MAVCARCERVRDEGRDGETPFQSGSSNPGFERGNGRASGVSGPGRTLRETGGHRAEQLVYGGGNVVVVVVVDVG